MTKEELNLDYKQAYEVFKNTMREGNYLLSVKVALEKQIPKKPMPYFGDEYVCPICGVLVNLSSGYKQPYCYECGQALDWGDSNGN